MISERNNLLALLAGKTPDFIPHFNMGFSNEKAIHTLLPSSCYDERTFYIPSDDPPMQTFPQTPRDHTSREKALQFAGTLNIPCIGVGNGGVTPFGHGGPAEIMPRVIERQKHYKILQYEGGHKRKIMYNPVSIQYYDFPLQQKSDLQNLTLPDMKDDHRFRDVEADADFIKAAGFIPTASVQGFFSGIHNSFMAMDETLMNLLLQPHYMRKVVDKLAEMNMQAVDAVMERGVEMIDVCDDLGNRDGLLISPELFKTFFLPFYKDLCSHIHKRGGWIHFHSHGNIEKLLPMFIEAGFDMVNPFDLLEIPQVLDLMEKFGDDMIFVGGLDSSFMYWDVEKQTRHLHSLVPRYVERCKKGYALMTHNLSADLGKTRFYQLMELIVQVSGRQGKTSPAQINH